EIHPRLFIPVDAQLIPGLLSDEVVGLTGSQQVIILPGATFQTTMLQPISLRSLVSIPNLTESSWQSLPEAPQLADQLHLLEYTPSQQRLLDETDDLLVILHPKTSQHFAPNSAFKTGQDFCLISLCH